MIERSKVVVFLGPDGAGKTTLLDLIESELAARDVDYARYYFAPGYLKRYRPSETPTVTTNPQAGRQYGAGLVLLKILLMLFEFNMGLPKVRRSNGLVLFDRFIHDLLVDPRRYRMSQVRWWMRALLKLAPRVDLGVIITAPLEIIQARKQEVTPEETERQLLAYMAAVKIFPRAIVVENVDLPEATAQRIVKEILNG